MTRARSNIAWIDVETDSLDAETGHLLEIACLVTDPELHILDERGFHAVIEYSDEEVAQMRRMAHPVVKEMHDKTGLWDLLRGAAATPLRRVDEDLLAYLRRFGERGQVPVAGNSVRLDMNFIDKHLPGVSGHLDYHMRDVSTVAGLANDWYDLPPFVKHNDHTAMVDIRESIRELKHYRELIFKSPNEMRFAARKEELASMPGSVSETASPHLRPGESVGEAVDRLIWGDPAWGDSGGSGDQ